MDTGNIQLKKDLKKLCDRVEELIHNLGKKNQSYIDEMQDKSDDLNPSFQVIMAQPYAEEVVRLKEALDDSIEILQSCDDNETIISKIEELNYLIEEIDY